MDSRPDRIQLGSIQETLLLPLWGRAVETQKQRPLLVDHKAVAIINSLPYDFSAISKNINKFVQFGWVARSNYFDKRIKEFIERFPHATIVNIGCGLDTTFERVDNGTLQWIDLDLPDAIELRKKYISESDRRRFIPRSVFDKSWYNEIQDKSHVMLLIAGVLFYFDECEVKSLFNDFHNLLPGVEVIFDYGSSLGIKISNRRVIEKGGMDKSAYIKWGIDDILELERWNPGVTVLSHRPMYQENKKNYSFMERIGMNIADSLKMMSLAHIRVD